MVSLSVLTFYTVKLARRESDEEYGYTAVAHITLSLDIHEIQIRAGAQYSLGLSVVGLSQALCPAADS
jgi:hypothetical protein